MKYRGAARKRKGFPWRKLGLLLLVLVTGLSVTRAFLPRLVRNYVNRTIDLNPVYDGEIGNVRISLWRGAYSIEDVRISKTTADVPVPLFSAKQVDFSLEWHALIHRRIVTRIRIIQPQLNFVDMPGSTEPGSSGGNIWLQM